MMLFDPGESPYDLRFRLLSVPVRVHPMFWLVSFFMGDASARLGFEFLLIWIGCVFVSILVHEMGHVLAGNAFGSRGYIVLYGFGGLAIGSNLIFINLFWGLVNLLPIWPLDGGQIAREGFMAASGHRGIVQSLTLSFGLSLVLAIHGVLAMNGRSPLPIPIGGTLFTVIFFGMFAVQSWQELQRANAERRWMRERWEDDERW